MPVLELPEIRATSPTLVEIMRACLLRAGLSKSTGSADFVLGNPKAWLGTAYHEALEKVGVEPAADVEEAAGRHWDNTVAAQNQRNSIHPLNRRFGLPETWPGYHVIRASALLRARELFAADGTEATPTGWGNTGTIRERQFVAFGGKLVGKPDVVRGQEIVDYKSGAILEYDETSQSEVVKAAYVRQLQIYGFLVKEALGRWPIRGVLLPFAGAGVDVTLEPSECTREAADAVYILDDYNSKVAVGATPDQLADPSPSACKWCSFKLICNPFWSKVNSDWSGQLDGAVVEGTLCERPRAIHGGAAALLAIEVQSGSEATKCVQLAPMNPNIHLALTAVTSGDRVRLVGLRARPDGSLVPTPRTVMARVEELPAVAPAVSKEVHDS